jgi:type II secretory pathway component PulF
MPVFNYTARTTAGERVAGELDAPDAPSALRALSARGLFPIDVAGPGTGTDAKKLEARSDAAGAFFSRLRERLQNPRRDLPRKLEQIAQLLRAGLKLSEALKILAQRSDSPAWRTAFQKLHEAIVGGETFRTALTRHPRLFPGIVPQMVGAGEASGHLVEILERLAAHFERREEVSSQVKLALVYPAFILIAGVGLVAFFMLVMLPKLAGMFEELGQSLPLATQLLIWLSHWMVRWGWTIPVGAVAAWAGLRAWLKKPENRLGWDHKKIFWPMIGRLVSQAEYARFSQTLATLLESGLSLNNAMWITADTLDNTALRAAAKNAQIQITQGFPLSQTLRSSGLFPNMMIDMIAVGERTGDLTHALQQTARTYERELDREVKLFTAFIQPLMILLMALFVGGIVLSVLMAVFDLTSGVGKL